MLSDASNALKFERNQQRGNGSNISFLMKLIADQ